MKKVILFAVALLIFQKWPEIKAIIDPPPDYSAEVGGKVILYSTAWCGYCAKARDLMEKNNIEYQEYDIEKSDKARSQYESLGGRAIPVLLIDGKVIHGYRPQKILQLAGKA